MKIISSLFCLFVLCKMSVGDNPKDSLTLKTINGKRYIIHKIDKGETLFSIAKKYNTTQATIKTENPKLKTPKAGQKINILSPPPSNLIAIDSSKISVDDSHANANANATERLAIKKHTVQQGETLQKIATKYKVSPSQIIRWNSLKGSSIIPKQELIVLGNTTIKSYEKWNSQNSLTSKIDTPEPVVPTCKAAEEIGVAIIGKHVSHPILPIGTAVICYNHLTQQQILLFIEQNNSLQQGVIIEITPAIAQQLQVTDNHHQVSIKYILH
jgi:LysM repeat protein